MIYQHYFKTGQKILLKALEHSDNGRIELLTAYLEGGDNNSFYISLAYGENAVEQYPFNPGMTFQISSEALGLGIQVTGKFEKKIAGNRVSLKINEDLQMFQRRNQPRLDCKVGIRFTRGKGTLKALRASWEKNVQLLQSPDAPLIFEGFKACRVSISSGGIRFNLRPPASPTELCLLLINLEDGKAPICALAEIVWTRPEKDETVIVSGMRFINILEEDQNRIDCFIKNRSRH